MNDAKINFKPTKQSRHERFKHFAEKSGEVFDVTKAANILNHPPAETARILARWQQQGLISRIKQGVYAIIPIDTSTENFTLEDYWVIIPRFFDPGYVGGFSALEHWDLTEQIFNSICVFTTKSIAQKHIGIGHQSFLVTHIQPDQLFGLKSIWRKQTRVMISDIHRTIIDIFDNSENGGGIQHAIDCLKSYLKNEEANPEKLIEYATQLNNGAVFKRLGYLLSHFLGIQNPTVLNFKKRLTQGYAYLDPKQKEDVKLVKYWSLFVPKALNLEEEQ